jgi:lysine-specific demethylase 8
VDIDQPDHDMHPAFASAACVECVVGPGDLLYIPPMWWHYVKSLEPSMSCSFWWK